MKKKRGYMIAVTNTIGNKEIQATTQGQHWKHRLLCSNVHPQCLYRKKLGRKARDKDVEAVHKEQYKSKEIQEKAIPKKAEYKSLIPSCP